MALMYHETCGAVMLLACDDNRSANALGAGWQVPDAIESRLLIVQYRRCGGVGRDHQEGLIPVARRGINALDSPLPCGIREDPALEIDQPTKRLRQFFSKVWPNAFDHPRAEVLFNAFQGTWRHDAEVMRLKL